MFGYHVHEKAILMVTIPMAVAAADSQWNARQYFVLSTVGHVALMPLLFTEQEYPIKVNRHV
jgi:alpha-1,3-glucosyltransferase